MAIKKTFNQWTKDDLRLTFGLRQIQACPALEAWLAMAEDETRDGADDKPISLDAYDRQTLERLYTRANLYIDDWNEWELRDQFIGTLISLADFNDPDLFFSTFSERSLQAMVEPQHGEPAIELSGVVDWMVATGMGTPRVPYFFVHEYKQEEQGPRSNRGQLLATMLAASQLNDDQKPMYGAYVLGRNWFFVVLENRHYCMSDGYMATKRGELEAILRILKAQKQLILARVVN